MTKKDKFPVESTGTKLFLLPDSCQQSAASTREELGQNEDWGWSETIHSALIIHTHFHESTGKGGIEYGKRCQSSWFCIVALLVVFRTIVTLLLNASRRSDRLLLVFITKVDGSQSPIFQ